MADVVSNGAPRTRSEIVERWVKIFADLAGVAVPVVLAVFGFYFTAQQDRIEHARLEQEKRMELVRQEQQRETELERQDQERELQELRQLIELMTHQEEPKRQMSVHLYEYLLLTERIPGLLQEAFRDYAERIRSNGSVAVLPAAGGSSDTVGRGEVPVSDVPGEPPASQTGLNLAEQLANVVEKARQSLPPRVYVHIVAEEQRGKAQDLVDDVEKIEISNWPIKVPGIELRKSGPRQNEFRYFKASDEEDAKRVFASLEALIPSLSLVKPAGYENAKIRPRHYELWFSREGL